VKRADRSARLASAACRSPLLPCGVPQYRIGQAAELLGVSADTVRRWADAGRVKATQGSGGRRYVDGADLARLAVELAGEQGRERSRMQSARNRFHGIVTHVTKDGVAAQVEVQSGPHRFVALITREAADDLELEPGMIADAVVKATNVGVEVPTDT
jgi:molybdopterin-binding protein